MKAKVRTGTPIQGAPLTTAPINELGVVFLFSQLQKQFGVRVESIQAGFPDCIARRTRGKANNIVRIEFEYKSANFRTHKHSARGCDWIVCWEHNWPDVPSHLRVVELRKEFGLGWCVWLNPKSAKWYDAYRTSTAQKDSIPKQAKQGDLLLIYFRKPKSQIVHIYRITGLERDAKGRLAEHSGKRDWWAVTKKVCALKCPLSLEKIKQRKELKHAGFVRGSCQARQNITAFWPELYRLIVELNPQARSVLKKYAPERMDGQIAR